MNQFSCLCTKREGKLKLYDLEGYNRALSEFGDGEELEMELRTAEEGRSLAQNKFFHGPILKAFMSLGYHKQEAKDMLAMQLIPIEVRMLDGSIIRMPGHTSALSKAEFKQFIEACIQLAAEQGIVVEDADQWREKQSAA